MYWCLDYELNRIEYTAHVKFEYESHQRVKIKHAFEDGVS